MTLTLAAFEQLRGLAANKSIHRLLGLRVSDRGSLSAAEELRGIRRSVTHYRAVVELVKTPPCHGGDRGFEPHRFCQTSVT